MLINISIEFGQISAAAAFTGAIGSAAPYAADSTAAILADARRRRPDERIRTDAWIHQPVAAGVAFRPGRHRLHPVPAMGTGGDPGGPAARASVPAGLRAARRPDQAGGPGKAADLIFPLPQPAIMHP